jgi:ufm1-conjugating enzyme 1
MADTIDAKTKSSVGKIPLLSVNAGPRDKDKWEERLKEVCDPSCCSYRQD